MVGRGGRGVNGGGASVNWRAFPSPPEFATMPSQDVRIGAHMTRQIQFLTPIRKELKTTNPGMDGLLPTAIFNRVFISFAGNFVIFDPKQVR